MPSLSLDRMRAEGNEQSHEEHPKIVVTSPLAKDVVITQPYVCQIRARVCGRPKFGHPFDHPPARRD